MKRSLAVLLILSILVLAACSDPEPVVTDPATIPSAGSTTDPATEAPTDPPETTEPTQPTEPSVQTEPTESADPNSLYPEQIEMLETVFSTLDYLTSFPTNWYVMGLCQEYDTPQDISMTALFNFGLKRSRDDYIMTDDELTYLNRFPEFAYIFEFQDEWTVCRIPREDAEAVLKTYFGLEPGEVTIDSERMVYWAETDCYYVAQDGYLGSMDIRVLSAVFQEDGTIRFTYTASNILAPFWGGEAVIKPVYGGFQMISNHHHDEPPQ